MFLENTIVIQPVPTRVPERLRTKGNLNQRDEHIKNMVEMKSINLYSEFSIKSEVVKFLSDGYNFIHILIIVIIIVYYFIL